MAYERGAHEVGDGAWAYLQPDGGWGWSNAGLVTDGDASLLVDTLFDLALTAQMLDDLRAVSPAAARDRHAREHPRQRRPLLRQPARGRRRDRRLDRQRRARWTRCRPSTLAAAARGRAAASAPPAPTCSRSSAAFTFEGIEVAPPTTTFEGELDLRVGDRAVHLLELGPAHTGGDVVVHLPDAGVLFTGDLVFHGGHPIVWAGPVQQLDRRLRPDAGARARRSSSPATAPSATAACIEAQRGYFEWLVAEGTPRLEGGLSPARRGTRPRRRAVRGLGRGRAARREPHRPGPRPRPGRRPTTSSRSSAAWPPSRRALSDGASGNAARPPGVLTYEEAAAAVTAPGERFEIETIDVGGVPVKAFKHAPPSLREIFATARDRGDATFLVYEDERWSFAEVMAHVDAHGGAARRPLRRGARRPGGHRHAQLPRVGDRVRGDHLDRRRVRVAQRVVDRRRARLRARGLRRHGADRRHRAGRARPRVGRAPRVPGARGARARRAARGRRPLGGRARRSARRCPTSSSPRTTTPPSSTPRAPPGTRRARCPPTGPSSRRSWASAARRPSTACAARAARRRSARACRRRSSSSCRCST